MHDIMIRIETDDFEAWKAQHYLHASNRAAFGITDGPAYQDIDNPKAALFHIKTDDMERAMQWFKTDTFKEASKLARVSGRTFTLPSHRPDGHDLVVAEHEEPTPSARYSLMLSEQERMRYRMMAKGAVRE